MVDAVKGDRRVLESGIYLVEKRARKSRLSRRIPIRRGKAIKRELQKGVWEQCLGGKGNFYNEPQQWICSHQPCGTPRWDPGYI